MQEGTPITFRMHRHNSRSKLPMSANSEGHLGVFVSSFSARIVAKHSWQSNYVEEKARVFSPFSKQIHTCEMNTMKTLDGRRFDPESIISLHWEALMKVMPPELILTHHFVAFRLKDLQFRSRSTHLINILPRDWPNENEFRKVVESWTPQACQLPHHTDRENVVEYEGCLISSNFNSASVMRRSKPAMNNWLHYDPASKEQLWQIEARKLLQEMMLRYEIAKSKGFKKEETT